jgi:predicted alpha/beta superfamily hydrolase
MPSKPVNIHASLSRLMKSKYSKRKYRISISLPYAYFKSSNKSWPFENPLEKWPVVYLIDANWFFGMVTDIVRNMAWFGNMTDAIIVGIGYPDHEDPQEALRDTIAQRFYDLSPVRNEGVETWISSFLKRPILTGDASEFLNFIRYELIPAIEQDFRTDPKKRILAGHSLGGTFTAFVLLENANLFDTYIIGSPFLSYGSGYIFNLEEQFAKRHKKLAAKVHLWVGELEETRDDTTLSDTIRFGAILESRKYKGLTLNKQIFPDLEHSEVIAPGFQAALKSALKNRN